MTEIVGVRFKEVGKVYSFDPCGEKYSKGCTVIVETSRGVEYGEVIEANHEIEDEKVIQPLRRVFRRATEEDFETIRQNKEKEREALVICQQKIEEHNLEMKAIDVDYTFDRSKILFYFIADGRVDFRELVRDLASVFKTRIELRQVGVRDEARLLGGLGICGRPFCCSSFLDDFQPVSIKMAKEQNLSLNPTKISGTCGRLMCCLKYEQDAYEDLHRTTPSVNSAVETPDGPGTVVDVNLLRGKLKVRLDSSPETAPREYLKCDVCPKGKACPKKPDVEAEKPASEKEESESKSNEGNKNNFNRRRRYRPHHKPNGKPNGEPKE